MISINNLSKVYHTPQQDILALDNVSFDVAPGEIFGIIGLSGAGKSTLIRCINMLEKPTRGSIMVNGQDITLLDKKELRSARQKIGMIFQQFNLLSSRTVFDNVMFPLEIIGFPKKEARQRVTELLALVGLEDKTHVYPAQLSGGQKQRVGIARALANHPRILLSDEATSALDPQTTRSILQLLKEINARLQLTILLITHDMNVIKEICDRVAVIDQSRIVEIGDVLNIFSNPQTAIARSFINSIINKEIPREIIDHAMTVNDQLQHLFVRMSFIGSSAGEPLVSSMVQRFDIKANILYGNIDRVKNVPFGNLAMELIGPSDLIAAALEYLRNNGVEIEVLTNA
jgi:D-methionine transport system ATP-binding protein